MKETKIVKSLRRKEAEDWDGNVGCLIKVLESKAGSVALWFCNAENSMINDEFIVNECGYYVTMDTGNLNIVNEVYYETLVEASDAFNKVADMIKK